MKEKSHKRPDRSLRKTAVHEAGHTLLGHILYKGIESKRIKIFLNVKPQTVGMADAPYRMAHTALKSIL